MMKEFVLFNVNYIPKPSRKKRKSQRKCKLYRRNAFDKLVSKYGFINPVEYKYA